MYGAGSDVQEEQDCAAKSITERHPLSHLSSYEDIPWLPARHDYITGEAADVPKHEYA
jgi:hypothetical protein